MMPRFLHQRVSTPHPTAANHTPSHPTPPQHSFPPHTPPQHTPPQPLILDGARLGIQLYDKDTTTIKLLLGLAPAYNHINTQQRLDSCWGARRRYSC